MFGKAIAIMADLGTGLGYKLCAWAMLLSAAAAEDPLLKPAGPNIVQETAKGVSVILWVVLIAVGLLVIVFLALKIRNELGSVPTVVKDPKLSAAEEAAKSEKKGDFVRAGMNYEALGETAKAAAMYERGRDFARAAGQYEKLPDYDKAVLMYKRSGESLKAAGVYMKAGNYIEAAKLFKNKGDTIRAAQAFEMMGSRLAAAREYEAAGQFLQAAKMYKDERMYKEAGEMYYKSLKGAPMDEMYLAQYYTYAAFLVMSDDLAKAEQVYESIARVDPSFRDVSAKLHLIGIRLGKIKPEVEEAVAEEETVAVQQEAPAPAPAQAEPVQETVSLTEVAQTSEASPEDLMAQLSALGVPEEAPAQTDESSALVKSSAAPTAPVARTEAASSAKTAKAPQAPAPANKVMRQGEIDDLFSQISGTVESEAEAQAAPLKRETTLRSIITSGKMEPKYSMRMWMQILKKLSDKHSMGRYYGCLPPEAIHIDMENNVRIEDPGKCIKEYAAPEVLSGQAADERADVYPMGVILFEMTTGSLDQLGKKYPIDIVDDMPEWLDALIVRCMERDREARYRSIDEVASIVMAKSAS